MLWFKSQCLDGWPKCADHIRIISEKMGFWFQANIWKVFKITEKNSSGKRSKAIRQESLNEEAERL